MEVNYNAKNKKIKNKTKNLIYSLKNNIIRCYGVSERRISNNSYIVIYTMTKQLKIVSILKSNVLFETTQQLNNRAEQ